MEPFAPAIPAAIPCCRPLAVSSPPTSHFTKHDVRSVHQTQAAFFPISIPSLAANAAKRSPLGFAARVLCGVFGGGFLSSVGWVVG